MNETKLLAQINLNRTERLPNGVSRVRVALPLGALGPLGPPLPPPYSMVPCTCRDVRIPVRPSARRPVYTADEVPTTLGQALAWSLGLLRRGRV